MHHLVMYYRWTAWMAQVSSALGVKMAAAKNRGVETEESTIFQAAAAEQRAQVTQVTQ